MTSRKDAISLRTSIIEMGDTPSQIIAYPIYGIYTVIEIGLRMVVLAILMKSFYEFYCLTYLFLVGTPVKSNIFEDILEQDILEESLFENQVSIQTLYEENQSLKNIIKGMEKSKIKMNEQIKECNQKNGNLKDELYIMESYVMLLTTFIITTGIHIVKVKIENFIWKKDKEVEEPSPEPAPSPAPVPDIVMGEIVRE